MKKSYDETGRPVNKDPLFLQFLRYAAVIVVSVCLLVLLICSIAAKDDVWFICFMFIAFMAFYITIPIIALWIYSLPTISLPSIFARADASIMVSRISGNFREILV